MVRTITSESSDASMWPVYYLAFHYAASLFWIINLDAIWWDDTRFVSCRAVPRHLLGSVKEIH